MIQCQLLRYPDHRWFDNVPSWHYTIVIRLTYPFMLRNSAAGGNTWLPSRPIPLRIEQWSIHRLKPAGLYDEHVEDFSTLFCTQLHIISLPLEKQGKTFFACFGEIGFSESWDPCALRCWRLDRVHRLIRWASMQTEIF